MPIHAVLGGTGGTGSAVVRTLLASQIPDLGINVLVRSKSKLLQAIPQLGSTSTAVVNIFETPNLDADTFTACVKGASTIYVCIGTNNASRKNEIAVTTATRLIAALGHCRKALGSDYKAPTILFNRSMALNRDVIFFPTESVKRFMQWAMFGIFEDLLKAGEMYATAERDGLLVCITADPPGMMDANGTEATGYELLQKGKAAPMLNYADFGAAMVELGQRRAEFGGKAVGVSATGAVRPEVLVNLWRLVLGLKTRLSPF
ncbi:hypothetical protein LTR62_008833 [Meristemomyces frigidus]|uniref:NAD(P)-binding domain-containing protein n=1 Tax=Meristemomyces frigidus TaxID=1508187 RepID=A0AAN7T924_9PEZI|nr:hypothetical protein LTR62_008833 [Meristemomyces frigidus]